MVFAALFLLFFSVISGCADLPANDTKTTPTSTAGPSSGEVTGGPDETSPGDVVLVNISTSIPTETPGRLNYTHPPETEKPMLNYSVIYSKNDDLDFNVISLDFNLKQPPMVFEYTLDISTVEYTKAGTSQYGDKDDYSYKLSFPNPNAWYEISVHDKETGELVTSEYLKLFAETPYSGSFMIYEAGDYHIEISGNLVNARTVIKVPPENLE